MASKRYAFTLDDAIHTKLCNLAAADMRNPSQMLALMIDRWADLQAAALATTTSTPPATPKKPTAPKPVSKGPQDFLDYVVLPDGRVFSQDPVPIWYNGQPQDREREYHFVQQVVNLTTGEFDVDDDVWDAWFKTDREDRDRVEKLDQYVKNECLNWRAVTFNTEEEVLQYLRNGE